MAVILDTSIYVLKTCAQRTPGLYKRSTRRACHPITQPGSEIPYLCIIIKNALSSMK